MASSWKRFEAWGTALRNNFTADIFTATRFKIVFLYVLMGIVILGAAGYLVYVRVLGIVQDIIQLIGQLLVSHAMVEQGAAASLVTETIKGEINTMNLVIGLWLIVTMFLVAYLLASVTLWPIKQAMDKQRRFLGNVSHELKTPLSVIKANSEVALLGANEMNRDELIAAVMDNFEEIEQMSKVTQFLLNFSGWENHLAKSEIEAVNLRTVAEKTIQTMAELAKEKGVLLVLKGPDEVFILGNAAALVELFLNLINNAIVYTPAGGSVKIALQKGIMGVSVSVEDSGDGISEKDMPNIFEPFYRGENAKIAAKDTNAGLGLAVVQAIVAMHHASVSVKSRLGRGTNFTVKFSKLSQWEERWLKA